MKNLGVYREAKEIHTQLNFLKGFILVHVPVTVFGASVATLRRLKMKQNSFKDDIESAERALLVISWIGVVSGLGIIAYSLLTFL